MESSPALIPGLTIIIPAFNEESAIGAVLAGLQACRYDFVHEIIVVDDCSSDGTLEIARQAGVRTIRHAINKGYGASLKSGVKAAQTEYVLFMDSDGQHRAEDIPLLWQQAASHDMVVGERRDLIHSPFWRMPGKWLLGKLANFLVRQRIPDLNSGMRILRREVLLRYIHLCPSGFSFTTTITMTLHNRGRTVAYVPIQTEKRVGTSTVSLRTGFDTLILIIRIASLFNPLQVFVPASLFTASVGVLWGIPYALLGRGVSTGSMLAIVTAVLLFSLGLLCDQISQLRLERYE